MSIGIRSVFSTAIVALFVAYFTSNVGTDRKADIRRLLESDIEVTQENIRSDKCHFPGYCFYLSVGGKVKAASARKLEQNVNLCKMDVTRPCLRINVKPLDENCERFQFFLAGIDIGADKEVNGALQYIALGFKQTNWKMPNALGLYCTPGNLRYGVIDERHVENLVRISITGSGPKDAWYENAPSNEKFFVGENRTFFSCNFNVKSEFTAYTPSMGDVNIGLGEWYLLLSYGIKIRTDTTDMLWNLEYNRSKGVPDDHHAMKGFTAVKFKDNKKWIVCRAPRPASASLLSLGILMFISLLQDLMYLYHKYPC